MTSTASAYLTGLDHIGFIVEDLDACGRFVSQLGFCLTERADHTRTNSAGELVSAGSSQRSVMLRQGYMEFMQITDPAAGHQLTAATEVRHGLHVLALGTCDAQACRDACLASGVPAGPLLHWMRPIREGAVQGEARFSYFDSRWDPQDPSYVCWVQHLTPAMVRPVHLLRHDNGALALTGVHYRGPRRQVQAWTAQLLQAGAGLARARAGGASLVLAGGTIEVDVDDTMPAVRPVAVVLAFSSLHEMLERCRRLGLAVRPRGDGSVDVDLVAQLGLHWICTLADSAGVP